MSAALQRLAPTLLFLLPSVVQPVAALRRQVRMAEKETVSGDGNPDNEAPLVSRSATGKEKVWEYMKEYEANLSHTRECKSSVNMVGSRAALLVPSLKLAFCYVPKVACTQFKDLINSLNNIDTPEGFGRKNYLASSAARLGVNVTDITRENGWKFATFTRDPALRFLSAFSSTCVSKTPNGVFENFPECCGPHVYNSSLPPEDLAKFFETRVQYDAQHGFIAEEEHWVPQVRVLQQCGWDDFDPKTVDFHGDLSVGDVNAQVKKMLRMAGGSEDWMMKRVDDFFPEGGVAGHHSRLRSPPWTFYRKRAVVESILRLYEDDYKRIPGVGAGFTDNISATW